MSREQLTKMTKIEVVVSGNDAGEVRRLFAAAGATGYTAISGVSGLGHHGLHQGRLLFNEQDTLALLISVLPDDRAEAVIAGLQKLFEHAHSGVMFISDSYVSRPDYFQ